MSREGPYDKTQDAEGRQKGSGTNRENFISIKERHYDD